ncbi:MAG: DUF4281 domain-containing protein [Anaerolineales bacterium]|nr:DUF4281 domain-containing protein [Anaerolineales bacterium]
METLFSISNLLTMPFWLLMILLPHWSWSKRIIGSVWIVAPAALLYAILIVPQMGGVLGDLMNPSLGAVQTLLGSAEGATVGWVHFLAFDLFVGRWAYLDARKIGLTAWISSPILFLVLMLGPLGFVLHLLARSVKTRSLAS